MAVRIKDWIIPYTWGIGIEITDNHVINVLLRAMNNLIMVNEDRELYVDLQLEPWIEPDADFPVGVTTGEILQEDWWQQSGTILNRKTTSWDYVRFIYANDDKLYYDPWTWEWRLLATWAMVEEALTDSNTKTFWIEDNQDLENAQAAYDWYMDGKSSLLIHEGLFGYQMLTLAKDETSWTTHTVVFAWAEEVSQWNSNTTVKAPIIQLEAEDWEVQSIIITYWRERNFLETWVNYVTPYTPEYNWSPATKKYVDDWLATKQDKLTAWTNITIDQNNVISATLPSALVYKGNVQTINDLPSSWQTVWDTYFVEWVDWMYSWDWTQWNYVGSTSPSLTNYFNMTINTSDDITEGSIHLFCSTTEKNYWNWKQDALTAWANIQISNNVISATDTTYSAGTAMSLTGTTFNNTKPFDPENAWVLSQVLKKTSTGYRWANETGWFDPENAGTTGQVLKKTNTGYAWANESWWWGWGWTEYTGGNGISVNNSTHVITNTKPFEPSAWGTVGQVLTKTADGYAWASASTGTCNVKNFYFPSFNDATQAEIKAVVDWVEADINNGAIINTEAQDVYLYSDKTVSWGTTTYRFFSYRNRTSVTSVTNGDFTTLKQIACAITYDGSTYTIGSTDFNPVANFLTVESSNYTTPYMPTADYQPATKAYVDAAVLGGWGWVLGITNNTTGTTYTITQEWAGTQAQYDALVNNNQILNWVIYNIIPSS